MKVSVIIPVYKVEDYLDQCVHSVVNQTHKDLEIILVDDGSPDRCPEMCDEWAKKDSRIQVIHKKNGGEGDARNEGLKKASGECVAFIDSDDYVSNDYVCNMKHAITNVQLVISGFDYVYEDHIDSVEMTPQVISCEKKTDYITKYHFNEIGYIAGKLYRLDVIRKNNIQFSSIKLKADQLFLFQYLSNIESICLISGHGYKYRQIKGSMSHLKSDFETSLSRNMDFYNALKVENMIDADLKKLLLMNFLDGPIGIIYKSNLGRKERITRLKQIDVNVYKETKIVNSWKERFLRAIIVSKLYYLFDWNQMRIFKKQNS